MMGEAHIWLVVVCVRNIVQEIDQAGCIQRDFPQELPRINIGSYTASIRYRQAFTH
jgi:hypothetical protein